MYAVIFQAECDELDDAYRSTAARLRELAFAEFNCREFTAVTEGGREIAVSWWDSEEDIRAWREAVEHRVAQRRSLERWYRSVRVDVVKVERSYRRVRPDPGARDDG